MEDMYWKCESSYLRKKCGLNKILLRGVALRLLGTKAYYGLQGEVISPQWPIMYHAPDFRLILAQRQYLSESTLAVANNASKTLRAERMCE